MMTYVIDGVRVVRDAGWLLLGAGFLYSFVRLVFEHRVSWSRPFWTHRVDLTPRGAVYRKRMFRAVAYGLVWYLAWSVILVLLTQVA